MGFGQIHANPRRVAAEVVIDPRVLKELLGACFPSSVRATAKVLGHLEGSKTSSSKLVKHQEQSSAGVMS